jgi:hypothetical protein
MGTPQPIVIRSNPGIKRDSTVFEGDNHVDGLWCRWNARALPTKIRGYQSVTSHLPEKVYGMSSFVLDSTNNLYLGSASLLTQIQTDLTGALGGNIDRTPVAFTTDPNHLWQIQFFYNKVSFNASLITAHPGSNLADIASSVTSNIYYGPITGGALTASAMSPVSGGILPVPPYFLAFGSGGQVNISHINDMTAIEQNSVFVTSQKIVAGLPLRNSTSPAAVLFSLDTLVTAVFDPNLTAAAGGIPTFDFNEVGDISVLSSQGIVEFDSIYYWMGVDRFYMFNGIIRELPNQMNLDFFFDNVNFTWRQKAFTFKIPRWGEIWFCAPLGSATECNHAVIYNARLNTWYDTPLPDGGRTAAVFASVFPRPFMCDPDLTHTGYTLWQHEVGFDKVLNGAVLPIAAFYQTHEISPIIMPPKAIDKAYRVAIIEPDFVQSGPLTCQMFRRQNARVPQIAGTQVTFPAVADIPEDGTELARFKDNARLLSFKFSTNTPGGNFTGGQIIGHIDITDSRMTG